MTISLCMIVKNEERYIKMCLENALDLVDEIIVVDTGSTDNTINIINQFEDKVILVKYEWKNDFSDARNLSLEKATGDWILILDADEKIKYNKNEIKTLLEATTYEGFKMPLYNILDNNNILLAASFVKLFRNKGYRYFGDIHEQLNIGDNISTLDKKYCSIVHYGYLSSNIENKNKVKRNLEIIKSEYKKNPNDAFTCFNLGTTYLMDDQYEKALKYLIKSHNISEQKLFNFKLELLKNIALCLFKLGNYNKCKEFITELLKDDFFKEYVDFHFILGLCHFHLNKYELAIKSFENCIKIGVGDTSVSTYIANGSYEPKLMIARIYAMQNRRNDAAMMYIEGIFDPNNFAKVGLNEAKEYLKNNSMFEILDELERLIGNK